MIVTSLYDSAQKAIDFFGVASGKPPRLIKTGVAPFDNVVGGMFPGACGILGMNTGVGKSSLMFKACLDSPSRSGILSLEDGPDVIGARMLAAISGVNSIRFRTGDLTPAERKRVVQSMETIREYEDKVRIVYAIGADLEEIETGVKQLADEGCEMVWLDYIQKARGASDDRRNEVSRFYSKFQRYCADAEMAGMVISQFSRQAPDSEPRTWWLKESGDLENEARVIMLGWRDKDDYDVVHVRLAKCTYGGEGIRFSYMRNEAGLLQDVDPFLDDEDF